MSSTVVSVNVSTEKGTVKQPAPSIELNELGVVGDAHAGPWHRQLSLLAQEQIDVFAKEAGREIQHGAFAENITTQGIDLSRVGLLDRIKIGSTELQITQIGKACHGDGCAIFQEVGKCLMPKEGLFARVLSGGTIQPNDSIELQSFDLSIQIITLSDRAAAGIYEDRSGPAIQKLLADFFADTRWHLNITVEVIPDEPDLLLEKLASARDKNIPIVITTGGTGVGPRDFAPQTIESQCDRLIPGLMDHIRLKYGADNPRALLSRSITGVMDQTLVYALPGSVKAVEEYICEIVKTLEHLLTTIHQIDNH